MSCVLTTNRLSFLQTCSASPQKCRQSLRPKLLPLTAVKYQGKQLQVKGAKNDQQRLIPLFSSQLETIQIYVQNERAAPKIGFAHLLLLSPLGGNGQSVLAAELLRWQEGSGLGQRLCWHVLRHTIATKLVNSGLELRLVAQFLGHKDLSSTSHYLHYQQKS